MVCAELQHNPYLLETEVKFNGQSPKINSQIEKYEGLLFADWVKDVPGIFYDEMNGYDFDLYFSGTEYDFQKLKKSFANNGITEEQVRLLMRNELEDAEIKSQEIDALINWFRSNRNCQFDFDAFYAVNRGFFEETFSCVVIRGKNEMIDGLSFEIENITDIEEIAGTNLTHVPVVFVIEESTLHQFKSDLLTLLSRKDIRQKQLFFFFAPGTDEEYVSRFICDLGVEEPQLIDGLDDGNVAAYIKNYPMVAYVSEVIQILEDEVNTLDIQLKEKNEQSAIENAEIYNQIFVLEEIIEKIKVSDNHFVDLDNFSGGKEFNSLKEELISLVRNWKSRKTKIVGDSDIEKNATDYEQEVILWVSEFYKKAVEHYLHEKETIENVFEEIYKDQPEDAEYKPMGVILGTPSRTEVIGIKDALMKLKEERYVEKTDFLEFFKAKSPSDYKELVREVTSYCENWREAVIEIIMPGIENYISESRKNLRDYYDTLANKYHEKLFQLQESKTEEKNEIASQLSEDERMLQADNDWLGEVKDQLLKIERG